MLLRIQRLLSPCRITWSHSHFLHCGRAAPRETRSLGLSKNTIKLSSGVGLGASIKQKLADEEWREALFLWAVQHTVHTIDVVLQLKKEGIRIAVECYTNSDIII